MALYRWIFFFLAAIIGGAASSFMNNRGMAKMWGWEKENKENYKFGIVADIIIGIAASIALLWTMTPQTFFQLLGMSVVGGYGGSSVLRALVNKLDAEIEKEKANESRENEKEYKSKADTNKIMDEASYSDFKKADENLTAIKNYLMENNKKVLDELYTKKIIKTEEV